MRSSTADSLLLETAAQMGAVRIFIDGVSLLRTVSNGNGNGNGGASYRDLLQQLIAGLQRENLTALLTHGASPSSDQASMMEIAEFVADTVIVLKREARQSGYHRKLEILKSRGQDFDVGVHTLRITGGKGLELFRRVQAKPRNGDAQPTSHAKRSAIGVDVLDTLMGGGVFDGSMTIVVGISGAGKTVLGTQLLLEGAQRQDQRGLMISLDQHPPNPA